MNEPTLRMYVDENGNYNLREDLSNDSNRYLCLTGVVMRIESHDLLTQRLDELKIKVFWGKRHNTASQRDNFGKAAL